MFHEPQQNSSFIYGGVYGPLASEVSKQFRNSKLEVRVCSKMHDLISVIGSISCYRGDAGVTADHGERRDKDQSIREDDQSRQLLSSAGWWLGNILGAGSATQIQMRNSKIPQCLQPKEKGELQRAVFDFLNLGVDLNVSVLFLEACFL